MNDSRQYLKYVFIIVAMLIAVASVAVSDSLIKKLAEEERQKMEIWTKAYRAFLSDDANLNMKLVLQVMEGNSSIPMIVCDEQGEVLEHRNLNVPEKEEALFLKKKVRDFKAKNPPFPIDFGNDTYYYLYYDDSIILKRLLLYPYVQLLVVSVFIIIAFLALASTKKAEQNKVWVGLSKETAHQLGTPISSLIAWVEYLKTKEVDAAYLTEMAKDVKRLEVIAERFSKIGSNPDLLPLNINEAVRASCEYMATRISSKVKMTIETSGHPLFALINESLFSWVIENLTKNAVDAMDGQGLITYQVNETGKKIRVDIADTGKGIAKSKFKAVFNPGYTTKARGWGLGLSLVRRIVESYPGGKIFVKNSEIGKGTTFRIEMHKYRKENHTIWKRK
ncbi:MAG: HAMP domain-containing histidine kinase [Tannerella sp.]|jgi:two-component sensor histidine kinase|nr:HAMP domain-containing histidine kinase [Tannerella sp.]